VVFCGVLYSVTDQFYNRFIESDTIECNSDCRVKEIVNNIIIGTSITKFFFQSSTCEKYYILFTEYKINVLW
jgi:hypothetical protein